MKPFRSVGRALVGGIAVLVLALVGIAAPDPTLAQDGPKGSRPAPAEAPPAETAPAEAPSQVAQPQPSPTPTWTSRVPQLIPIPPPPWAVPTPTIAPQAVTTYPVSPAPPAGGIKLAEYEEYGFCVTGYDPRFANTVVGLATPDVAHNGHWHLDWMLEKGMPMPSIGQCFRGSFQRIDDHQGTHHFAYELARVGHEMAFEPSKSTRGYCTLPDLEKCGKSGSAGSTRNADRTDNGE